MNETDSQARCRALLGSEIASRYRLDALIGMGASGGVFRASEANGNRVAVKVLYPDLMDSAIAERFSRESALLLDIRHPNVVQTLEAGRDDARRLLYLVMPLLQGEDTAALLARTGPLEPRVAVRLALQAANGLLAAHLRGIIHRDVKPANLYLDAGPNGTVIVRVCDFGIAKRIVAGSESTLTRTGTQLGTPDYISPEQLRDSKTAGEPSDIWGLGATLYEMLCGVAPFGHLENMYDVISAILTQPVPRLGARAPWLGDALCGAVERALERKVEARYPTMRLFAEALAPYGGGGDRVLYRELLGVKPVKTPAGPSAKPAIVQPSVPGQWMIPAKAEATSAPGSQKDRRRTRRWVPAVLGIGVLILLAYVAVTWRSRLLELWMPTGRAGSSIQGALLAQRTPVFSNRTSGMLADQASD